MLSSPKTSTPSEFQSSAILLCRNCWEARLWKYLAFLSPNTIQWTWLLYCHIFSFNRSKSLTSALSCKKSSTFFPVVASTSTAYSSFFFPINSTKTLQKECLLHCVNLRWQESIFDTIAAASKPEIAISHASITVLWQPLLSSHICSKCQGRCDFTPKQSGKINIRLWSEVTHDKVCTFCYREKINPLCCAYSPIQSLPHHPSIWETLRPSELVSHISQV